LQDHRDPVRLGHRDGPLRDLRDLDRHPRQRDTALLERLADEIRALLGKAELRRLGGRDDVDLAILLLGRLGDGADLCELLLGKIRRRRCEGDDVGGNRGLVRRRRGRALRRSAQRRPPALDPLRRPARARISPPSGRRARILQWRSRSGPRPATLAAVREELLVEDDLRSGMALAAALGDRF
jgi:hypothetical protein